MQLNKPKDHQLQKPNKKLILLIGLSLAIGIAIAILLWLRTPPPPITLPPTATQPTPTIAQTAPRQKEGAYLLNRINTLQPVTGYSWNDNLLIYSTPSGIYSAQNNNPIIETPISYISWSANGFAVYQSNNQWYWFHPKSQQSIPVTSLSANPKISPNGQFVVWNKSTTLYLLKLNTNETSTTILNDPITALAWSNNNQLGINQQIQSETVINIFNTGLIKLNEYRTPFNSKLLALSPTSETIAMAANGTLEVLHPQNNKIQIQFQKGAALQAVWIDDINLIVIETTKDEINRTIDIIWKITATGEKQILTNSISIPRKIDVSIPITINKKQTTLPLVEKKSKLWILSLTPNLLPSYDERGLTFFPISTEEGH